MVPACLPTDKNQQYTNWEAVVSGEVGMIALQVLFIINRLGHY